MLVSLSVFVHLPASIDPLDEDVFVEIVGMCEALEAYMTIGRIISIIYALM